MQLPESARNLIERGVAAHLVTLNADGSPQVTIVWMSLDGDDLVSGHLSETVKVRNIRRDGRIAVTFESPELSAMGLTEYLVVYGDAVIETGGGAALLQKLAHVYLGPEVKFPAMDNPPAGFVCRIKVRRFSGVGPWTGRPV